MSVIGRTDNHRIDLRSQLVKHLPKVGEFPRAWKPLVRIPGPLVVNVTDGHDVLLRNGIQIAASLTSEPNDRDVQFFVGRLTEQR